MRPWVMELFGGMREACEEHALSLVGGNLARGPEVTVAVTVTGEVAPGRAVTRAGARPGDVIVVTGTLGAAAAGRRLASGRTPPSDEERAAILRHLRPTARIAEAGVLAQCGATAMIDVSDGLTFDLSRVCDGERSGRARPARRRPDRRGGHSKTRSAAARTTSWWRRCPTRVQREPPAGARRDLRRGPRRDRRIVSEPGLLAVDETGAEAAAHAGRMGPLRMSGQPRPRALTIAGSDSGGGAGIQADLKTFSALGVFGMTAITAVTVQNTQGVSAYEALPAETVGDQIRAVATDIGVDAAKSGMLANAAIVEAVADAVTEAGIGNLVVDPVFVSEARARAARGRGDRRAPHATPAAGDARHTEPAGGRGVDGHRGGVS